MIKRIAEAYLKSKEKQTEANKIFSPGYWEKLSEKKREILEPLIRNNDYKQLEQTLKNVFRNKELIEGFFETFNPGLFLSEYKKWEIFDVGRLEEAEIPDIGNQPHYTIGTYISNNEATFILNPVRTNLYSLRFHKLAKTVKDIIKTIDGHPVIAELGPGYGGLTYSVMNRNNRKMTYILYDLPEINIISSYFLTKSFPKKKFLFFNEEKKPDFIDYDIIILPNFEITKLEDEYVDFYISIRTLGESMNVDSVDFYTDEIMRQIKIDGYFFHERCNKSPDDYLKKLMSRLVLLYEKRALFHNTCNYEYLFQKLKYSPMLANILMSRRE